MVVSEGIIGRFVCLIPLSRAAKGWAKNRGEPIIIEKKREWSKLGMKRLHNPGCIGGHQEEFVDPNWCTLPSQLAQKKKKNLRGIHS